MSPVRATCVPPQNSFDSPMVTTRTVSPYFSPKKAMAPACLASAIGSTAVSVAALRRMRSLTRSSTRCFSSSVSGAPCEKSKRRRSGATSEPFWVTCAPSTWRSAQCSRCVAEWLRRMSSRRLDVDGELDGVADAQLARRRPRRSGPTASTPGACSRARASCRLGRGRASPRRPSGRPARRRTASRRRRPRRPSRTGRRPRPPAPSATSATTLDSAVVRS